VELARCLWWLLRLVLAPRHKASLLSSPHGGAGAELILGEVGLPAREAGLHHHHEGRAC
jgi:hypothetical protein